MKSFLPTNRLLTLLEYPHGIGSLTGAIDKTHSKRHAIATLMSSFQKIMSESERKVFVYIFVRLHIGRFVKKITKPIKTQTHSNNFTTIIMNIFLKGKKDNQKAINSNFILSKMFSSILEAPIE